MHVDLFVCQFSTNDAWTQFAVGEWSGIYPLTVYDTATVMGSVEHIATWVRETWGCPVVFRTSPRFVNDKYDQMVLELNRSADL
ncbi:MAG: hypothetical protein ACOX17_08970 [Christensenellales bacterium]